MAAIIFETDLLLLQATLKRGQVIANDEYNTT
jgi:hypothetical protein